MGETTQPDAAANPGDSRVVWEFGDGRKLTLFELKQIMQHQPRPVLSHIWSKTPAPSTRPSRPPAPVDAWQWGRVIKFAEQFWVVRARQFVQDQEIVQICSGPFESITRACDACRSVCAVERLEYRGLV